MSDRVTLKDVYQIVQRLEDKIDDQLQDHEKRIRSNENFVQKATVLAGGISAFVSLVATYIWNKVTGQL